MVFSYNCVEGAIKNSPYLPCNKNHSTSVRWIGHIYSSRIVGKRADPTYGGGCWVVKRPAGSMSYGKHKDSSG